MPPTSAERKSRLPITRWHLLGVLGGALFGLAACGGSSEVPLPTGVPLPTVTPEASALTVEKVAGVLRMADTLWPTLGVSIFMGVANAATARRGWRQVEAVAKFQSEQLRKSVGELRGKLQRTYESKGGNGAGGILAAFGQGGLDEASSMDSAQFLDEAKKLAQTESMLLHWEQRAKAAGGVGVTIKNHQIGLPSRTVAIDVLKEGIEGTGATFYAFQVALPAANQFLSSLLTVEANPAQTILLGSKIVVVAAIGILATIVAWKKQGGKEI